MSTISKYIEYLVKPHSDACQKIIEEYPEIKTNWLNSVIIDDETHGKLWRLASKKSAEILWLNLQRYQLSATFYVRSSVLKKLRVYEPKPSANVIERWLNKKQNCTRLDVTI